MTQDQIAATRDALAASPSAAFLERLAEATGGRAGVQAVFGAPIEREGVTVVPVARVRWGVGGGGGDSVQDGASGTGAGAGVIADPVGYLEVSAAGTTYHPISRPFANPVTILAAALGLALVIRAAARLRG